MRRWEGGWAWVVWGASLAWASPAASQDALRVRPGELAERVVARIDTSRAYALYLPSAYSPERSWPVLYVMDPRGRAVSALELFRPAAEELGWVVASSYDSRSDVPEDLNTPAFNAMLDDTQRRLRVDTDRLYLAGFSGTAASAWSIAPAMSGHVAGIVVAGFGLPLESHLQMEYLGGPFSFAVYGTAGRTGFNFEDVWDMDAALDAAGVANRIVYFDGGHRWMPPDLAADALRWLELRAALSGLRPAVPALLAEGRAAVLERADALLAEARELEAARLLDGATDDFGDDDADIVRLRDRIAGSDRYEDQRRRRERESREASEYSDVLRERFGGRAGEGPRIAPNELARELRVEELLRRASAEGTPDAVQARRLLASAAVLVGFYGPRDALEKGRPGHALDYLEVAERIDPGDPGHCRFRAYAHAQREESAPALEALRCWTGAARPEAADLRSDPYLAPLRDEAAFQALLEELGGRR